MNILTDAAAGQVSLSAADMYEEFFVPALFGKWAVPVTEAAAISPGNKVLDVACGTGCAARAAARRAAPGGRVIGLDRNSGMLSTARRIEPGIDWREGRAEELPFEDRSFDAVTCQFGLMFFENRVAALAEMWRVLRPGGRLVVAVWDGLEASPGYATMFSLLERLFGNEAAAALAAPFILGDTAKLLSLFISAGVPHPNLQTRAETARFRSITDWVKTEVKGWTLADMIDDAQYQTLKAAASRELAPFAARDDVVVFPVSAHIVTATRQ